MKTTRRSLSAWGAAGVPLLVTLCQALMALLGYTSRSVGIAPIVEPVLSISVLFEAAVVFKSNSALVLGLFVLIAVAWGAEGVSMFRFERRTAAYGAATLSGVLFFILFFGVYAPLFTADVPSGQLVMFGLIPIAASGAMGYAAQTYPWEASLDRQTTVTLGHLEEKLDDATEEYASAFDRRLPPEALDSLANVAPDIVAEARQSRREFESTSTELREQIDKCRSMSPDRRNADIAEIERQITSLSPAARVDETVGSVRDRLAEVVRADFTDVAVESPYGTPYQMVNLPTEHREFHIPGVDGAVHIAQLGETTAALVSEESLSTVAEAIQTVNRQLADAETYLDGQARPVTDAIGEGFDSLETVESLLADSRLEFTDRLEDILLEGRIESVTGARELRQQFETAQQTLHECRFDEAHRVAERSAEASDTLVLIWEFARAVSTELSNNRQPPSVPREIPDEVVRSLATAADKYHTRTVSYDGNRLRFGPRQSDSPAQSDGTENSPTTEDQAEEGTIPPASQVVDEVLFVFRELADRAETNDQIYQHRIGDLPESIATEETLVNLQRFANRQPDLFDEVVLQSRQPPGFFEVTAAESTDAHQAIETALDRFREQYG